MATQPDGTASHQHKQMGEKRWVEHKETREMTNLHVKADAMGQQQVGRRGKVKRRGMEKVEVRGQETSGGQQVYIFFSLCKDHMV